MTMLESRPDRGAVRAWARANGIPVSKTGNIAVHVRESYLEAHPEQANGPDSQLLARNSRPDLFALADDMVEAEMVRTGRLAFEAPAPVSCDTATPALEAPLSLSEWLQFRDELAAAIAEHPDPREAAESLLIRGWMRKDAA